MPQHSISACLVFENRNMTGNSETTYEQCWILFASENLEQATQKALEYGNRHDEIFMNAAGDTIHWRFIGLRFIGFASSEGEIVEICTFATPSGEKPLIRIQALHTEAVS